MKNKTLRKKSQQSTSKLKKSHLRFGKFNLNILSNHSILIWLNNSKINKIQL